VTDDKSLPKAERKRCKRVVRREAGNRTDQDIRQPRPRNKRHRTLIHLRGPSWRNHRTFAGQLANVHHLTHDNNISCSQIWGVCEMPML
jgi:hypothetical protein